ncbi:MAG: LexA family transcriptional regulator [Alphaproteobacteria bacterium]|nr:LexA family transcriptional regulator [Alphaproteobacteria bacterium]
MNKPSKNIKFLRVKSGLTQEKFAKKLGIKRSLLGAYEEDRAVPNLSVIKKLCAKFEISFEEFLLKDIATIMNNKDVEPIVQNTLKYTESLNDFKNKKPKNSIQFVPIKAAAGYLQGYSDQTFIEELNSFTLPMIGSGHYRAFEIKGDSMLPTPSGSIIIGEKIASSDDIKSSNTYIVLTKEQGIVYKRVVKKNKYKIELRSDNEHYEPYLIDTNAILEIWKAQYVIQKPSN